jgi:hypothetical protein
MPPPSYDVLPETVLSVSFSVAPVPSFRMPPPQVVLAAVLPEMVQSVSVRVPRLSMPPPLRGRRKTS